MLTIKSITKLILNKLIEIHFKISMPDISALEKTGAAQILAWLYNNTDENGINISEISKNVNAANETVGKTVDFLALNKLVIDDKKSKFPFKRKVSLTSLGRQVAKALVEVSAMMQAQEDQESKTNQ